MGFDSQTCFILKEVGSNLDKNHIVFTVKILFEIFKEIRPELFKKDKKTRTGPKRTYKTDEMLPFISFGHIMEITSCRKLENWWKNNDESCQFLLNCKKPSKTTINDFTNNKMYLIDEFDKFLMEFGIKTGLIEGNLIYADGTVLKGYCNPHNKMYPDQIKYLKKFILKHYKEFKNNTGDLWIKLHEFFYNDKYQDELKDLYKKLKKTINSFGIHLLKLSLKDHKSLKRVLKRIKEMEANISGKNSISTVDPETRHMDDKKRISGLNYNYQQAIDDKCGMIVTHYITQHPNDQLESIEIVNRLQRILNKKEFTLVVDHGYWHIKTLHRVHRTPTKLIIPNRTEAMRRNAKQREKNEIRFDERNAKKQRFKKYNFKYLPKEDAYLCPAGIKLTRKDNSITKKGIKKRYNAKECEKCRYLAKCSKKEYRREITDTFDPILDKIKKEYYTEYGQTAYSGRGSHAEGGFAILLESRNFRGIKTKGVKKANNEMTRTTITHNIKKIHKHINNKTLNKILNEIKKEKQKQEINMNIFDKWINNYIIENDKIIDFKN
ncbi:transposase [Methanobrevibacter sp.]|jgi:hypothetical protein|uniref:transposase n=1 Tax=Methanobrevibacter sp. TaxID=66852 RepID=UPI00388DCDE6